MNWLDIVDKGMLPFVTVLLQLFYRLLIVAFNRIVYYYHERSGKKNFLVAFFDGEIWPIDVIT